MGVSIIRVYFSKKFIRSVFAVVRETIPSVRVSYTTLLTSRTTRMPRPLAAGIDEKFVFIFE